MRFDFGPPLFVAGKDAAGIAGWGTSAACVAPATSLSGMPTSDVAGATHAALVPHPAIPAASFPATNSGGPKSNRICTLSPRSEERRLGKELNHSLETGYYKT